MIEKQPIPILGKQYTYFDDGKIRPSRKITTTITGIIPFDSIDSDTLSEWQEEVSQCGWLYAWETDYFITADLDIPDQIEHIVFVRTVDGGWFSLGFWAGRLDIDGKLTEIFDEYYYPEIKAFKEIGYPRVYEYTGNFTSEDGREMYKVGEYAGIYSDACQPTDEKPWVNRYVKLIAHSGEEYVAEIIVNYCESIGSSAYVSSFGICVDASDDMWASIIDFMEGLCVGYSLSQ